MKRLLTILAIASATTACATHKLAPPQGFAQVDHNDYGTTMIAPNHVGLNVRVGDNVKGGSLGFWSEDLVNKLGTRGYTLTRQSAVKSKNGVAGTRFDFDYTAPDGVQKFYSAVLFASDKYRVVLQIAGDAELGPLHLAQLDGIAGETKIGGCKLINSLCKSPQPRPLSSAPAAPSKAPAQAPEGESTPAATTDA
jgi:hypothetical protein